MSEAMTVKAALNAILGAKEQKIGALTEENEKLRSLLRRSQSLLNEFRDPDFTVSALNVFGRIVELEAQIRAALTTGGDL